MAVHDHAARHTGFRLPSWKQSFAGHDTGTAAATAHTTQDKPPGTRHSAARKRKWTHP
jgi:hypothetical protein